MRKIDYLPRTLGIELVRGCNFNCPACPVTSNKQAMQNMPQFIDLSLLEQLANEIDRWPSIDTIWFFHFGEPMLHPHYRRCLETLSRSSVAHKANVIQHTNASLLQGDNAEAILDIPIIKQITFSFDGFGDRESFNHMRGPHYDLVLENIRRFAYDAHKRRPDLRLATCTILPREGEVPNLVIPPHEIVQQKLEELFRPLGIDIQTRYLHNYSGNDRLFISSKSSSTIAGGCTFVEQNSIYFTVNGYAQPCCAVYNESFNIGRFPENSFGELIKSDYMQQVRHSLRLDNRHDLLFCRNCSLSVDSLGEDGIQKFWIAADERGEIENLDERRHIFQEVLSLPRQVLRLDIGCGLSKPGGFVGIDRMPLSDVDVVADLDFPLPFADNTFDLILASHSLEHVQDIIFTMKEIYRIARHGAQVCIVAPYYQQGLNIANPYHKQNFNEHSPRFWTNSPLTFVESSEYIHPHAGNWNLSESDHSTSSLDLRCLRMEFFYFPQYRYLALEEQREARKKYLDVCDQIMYHLVVAKEPMEKIEMEELARTMEYYEPSYVTNRRLQERCEKAERDLAHARADLAQILEKSRTAVFELDAFRHSKIAKFFKRFLDRSDFRDKISPTFQQLKDDSLIFNAGMQAYRLQPSINLTRIPFLQYSLDVHLPNLKGILLAAIPDLPMRNGVIGVEIVSPSNKIVTQSTVMANEVDETIPVRFDFDTIKDSGNGPFYLRVFTKEIETPVRIFEWRKYKLFGLGPLRTKAFCGFVFEGAGGERI